MKKIKVIVAALLLCANLMFAGCGETDVFTQRAQTFDGKEINTLIIDVIDREIIISNSSSSIMHIEYFESEKEFYKTIVNDQGTLEIKYADNKNWSDYIGKKPDIEYRKIKISIPPLMEKMVLKTTNALISVSNVEIKNSLTLNNNGGDIRLNQINSNDKTYLSAKNGNISGTILGKYDDYAILCEVKKGESNLLSLKKDGIKTLNVNCNNGNVELNFIN